MERYVCHGCGRSFERVPLTSQDSLSCPNCHSDFCELIEVPHHPEREEDGVHFQWPGGHAIVFGGGERPFFSGGGVMSPNTLTAPLSFTDLIRLVVRPDSLPPDHPIWQQIGFHGQPGDYAFNESAFQQIISSLMQQPGVSMVGLTAEQAANLPVVTANEGSCAICQDTFTGEEVVKLNCGHEFHEPCIMPWIKKVASCPVCRHNPMEPYTRAQGAGGGGGDGGDRERIINNDKNKRE